MLIEICRRGLFYDATQGHWTSLFDLFPTIDAQPSLETYLYERTMSCLCKNIRKTNPPVPAGCVANRRPCPPSRSSWLYPSSPPANLTRATASCSCCVPPAGHVQLLRAPQAAQSSVPNHARVAAPSRWPFAITATYMPPELA